MDVQGWVNLTVIIGVIIVVICEERKRRKAQKDYKF